MDVNVELCKFFQKFRKGDPFTSYFMKILRNYGKVLMSCPMKVVRVFFISRFKGFDQALIISGTLLRAQFYFE